MTSFLQSIHLSIYLSIYQLIHFVYRTFSLFPVSFLYLLSISFSIHFFRILRFFISHHVIFNKVISHHITHSLDPITKTKTKPVTLPHFPPPPLPHTFKTVTISSSSYLLLLLHPTSFSLRLSSKECYPIRDVIEPSSFSLSTFTSPTPIPYYTLLYYALLYSIYHTLLSLSLSLPSTSSLPFPSSLLPLQSLVNYSFYRCQR